MIGRLSIARKLLVTGALIASIADAQTSGGIFRGEVRDPSNAVVPQAKVIIRSNDNGTQVTAESNGDGLYVTPTMIPGSYTLSATKPGFETEMFGPVTLEVNQTVRVDFALNIGAASDSVQVEASGTQLLSTESAELSQVIVSKQVSEIPLNGRSWQQLIDLSAGVNPGAPGESGSPNPVNIDGQRTKANLYLVDGVSTTSSLQGRGNDFNIPLEAVREFSVQAGSYSAEYGDVAGGVINLQSKSGTNNWHGSLFEFFRNDMLDASNFFSNLTGQPKNALRYNQFGGSAGGPIRRNKTFFFADYQGTVTHSGQPMITSVPLSAQRGGNFSAPGSALIYDPFSTSYARTPFLSNTIPASLLNPAAVEITSLLPQPNQFGAGGTPLPFNNYAVTRVDTSNVQSFDVRVDHQFSERNSLFARESFQNTSAVTPSIFGLPLGGSILGAGATSARNQNAGIGYTSTISPTLLNELRLGVNRQTTVLTQEDYGQNLSQKFGIPGVNVSPQTSGLSSMVVAGLFNIGGSLLTPLSLATTQWNFTDKITWVKGRHVIRLGFDYQHEMGSTGYLVYGRGEYTFLNLTTSSLVGTPGGNAFASFLVGAPYQILRDEFPPGLVGLISYRLGFFAQDDIKVTQRLTINVGARYDIMPYPREMHDRLSNFDPATGTMLIAGQDTNQRLVNTDYKDLAPRVGLAYSPTGKTVIRAGYGIGFIDPYGAAGALNSNEFNVPFYYLGNITEFPFTAPTYTLSSVLPGLLMPSPNAPTGNQRSIVPTDGNQYSQTWSFTVQRALNPSLMFEAAYVGTSGNRLLTASDLNAALPGATNPVLRQPFGPALGEIRELSNSAHSIYHGLQSKIEKRFSGGLYFLGSYTWSKSIDNQSNGTDTVIASGQYPQDPLNNSLDRGLSSFDRPQVFVGSVVWEIPFGRGPAERSPVREFANAVAGGWQLSGDFSAESGTPFSVLMSCADINAEGDNCRPNRIASGALPSDQRSIDQWFDTAAFAIPSTPEFGNAGRNILRAPGVNDIDLALSKSFPWGSVETRRLQVRGEFFNTLNHTNLGVPVNSIDSPAFGTITSAGPGREIQLGARLEF
ncbi:MAG TPA: carboxypeptidase regulatory-like domain-containing protein [Bryobacteraceae bacterium]|nr:carboxypeptidase regulatory-like domain-containing protein [Bryobacteraceae bacterium]